MRIPKVLVIILVILVVIFLSLGFFVDLYEYGASVQVQASPEKCWKDYHDTKVTQKKSKDSSQREISVPT